MYLFLLSIAMPVAQSPCMRGWYCNCHTQCMKQRFTFYIVAPAVLLCALHSTATSAQDIGKQVIETRIKETLHPSSVAPSFMSSTPGLVSWHESFAAALAASRTSKKPVLLFHLLGRLDDPFC